jgi:hypothetical protein
MFGKREYRYVCRHRAGRLGRHDRRGRGDRGQHRGAGLAEGTHARSAALNQKYGLGHGRLLRSASSVSEVARSDGCARFSCAARPANHRYGSAASPGRGPRTSAAIPR